MKNFHQNLLIVLALALCALCALQWRDQTRERMQITHLNQLVYDKSAAIQGYTNSIETLNHQIVQMDARITELKETAKTNDELVIVQKREINKLDFESQVLTNQITQYQQAVDTLQTKLKETYDGIKKQNDAITNLTAQRDEFVQKLNDSVKERNDVVSKYNELVQKLQPPDSK